MIVELLFALLHGKGEHTEPSDRPLLISEFWRELAHAHISKHFPLATQEDIVDRIPQTPIFDHTSINHSLFNKLLGVYRA
jgi:hypothetical protein